nr:MAG TPA: hypothetical protein [Caudoviricetes sp.]DAO84343.1 MAG TPA: hypothetical protein [Caudoviricetes sp.]
MPRLSADSSQSKQRRRPIISPRGSQPRPPSSCEL